MTGYHADEFHRKLVLKREDMQFINTVPIRAGAVELEAYQENGLIMKEPDMCKIIQDNLGVKVTSFHVSASQVKNVLAIIKCELISRLSLLEEQRTTVVSASEDILEFKPNFCGIGLNLNALKRKWFPKRKG